MTVSQDDKRSFLRVPITVPIKIAPNIVAKSVDISESGVGLITNNPLPLSVERIALDVSRYKQFEAEFEIMWSRYNKEDDTFRYGTALRDMSEINFQMLLLAIIRSYVEPSLNEIKAKKDRDLVEKFWYEHFLEYLNVIAKIDSAMKKNGAPITEAYEKTKVINDQILQLGDKLEGVVKNKRVIRNLKKLFRDLCGGHVYQAQIVKHSYVKPRGYPGDHELIEKIYNQQPVSKDIGYCYDKYLLDNEYATAVRNRKESMKNILYDYVCNGSPESMNILNIACGSSREIKEILTDCYIPKDKCVHMKLVDQDPAALDFSKEILQSSPSNITYTFLAHNVIDYTLHPEQYYDVIGKQDLVYSIGLADYLPDRILKRLVAFCFAILRTNGSCVIAHKDSKEHKPLAPDWWCDWNFYHRSQDEVISLVNDSGITDYTLSVHREPSNIIFFVTIEKK